VSQCVNCHKFRSGRTYTFHVGEITGRTVAHQVGSTTTTTQYRLFGAQDGFLCNICGTRYLVIRFFAPMLLCIGLELGAFYGFDPLGFQLSTGAVPLVLLAALVLQVIAGSAVVTTIGWQQPGGENGPVGCLTVGGGILAIVGGMLSFMGGLIVTGLASDLSDRKHSLFGTPDPHMDEFNAWLVGLLIGFQLVIYLNVWAGRQLLLENKVWRRRRRTLRAELGVPKLVGFNTARYRTMRKN
jgi:hypothetical protein